uniref:Uncharacterized protein n=1 Tax=Mycena chlorophos TaxID=658473 RepID=A0ABQ0LQL0_MYCCL|nr:predicted protein [Mycena chlorophos]
MVEMALRRSARTHTTRTYDDDATAEVDAQLAAEEKENQEPPVTGKRKRDLDEQNTDKAMKAPQKNGKSSEKVPLTAPASSPILVDKPASNGAHGDDGVWMHSFVPEEVFSDDDDGASNDGSRYDEEMGSERGDLDTGSDDAEEDLPKRNEILELTIDTFVMRPTKTTKSTRRHKLKTVLLDVLLADLTWTMLRKEILKKVAKATNADLPRAGDYSIEFTVPRHHKSSTDLDGDTFRTLISKAKKNKKAPEAKLTMIIPEPETAEEADDDDEEEQGPKRKKARSGAPKERDLDPANQPINDKIGILREKYKGSYVDPVTAESIALGNPHYECWAEAWVRSFFVLLPHGLTSARPLVQEAGHCNEFSPPHHALFDAANPRNRKSELQRRADQQAAMRAPPALPPIQVTIVAPEAAAPRAEGPAASGLIPAGKVPGDVITIEVFCRKYELSEELCEKLLHHGFRRSSAFDLLTVDELKTFLLIGEIGELRYAIGLWVYPAD